MKKLIKQKLLLLCALSFSLATQAQQVIINPSITPSEATEMVSKDLPNLISLINPEDMKQFGFNENDNFENIHVGRPFYMSLLPTKSSETENVEATPHTILVPLILNGNARCVVYVSPVQGHWQTVGLGESIMVQNNAQLFNAEDANSYSLIQVPQANQIFFMNDNSFSPLFHFEGVQQNEISFSELIAINNAPAQEAIGMTNGDPENINTDSSTENK